jgi:hypothetical protein
MTEKETFEALRVYLHEYENLERLMEERRERLLKIDAEKAEMQKTIEGAKRRLESATERAKESKRGTTAYIGNKIVRHDCSGVVDVFSVLTEESVNQEQEQEQKGVAV